MAKILQFPQNQICHICGSSDSVKLRKLPVIDRTTLPETEIVEEYRYSKLCKKCEKNGWDLILEKAIRIVVNKGPKTKRIYKISYWNWQSSEIKTVDFTSFKFHTH